MICLQSLHSVGVVTIQSFILCPICLVPFGYVITWLYYCIIIILHGFHFIFFPFLHYMVYVLSGLWVMLLVGGLIPLFMYHHLFMCSLWSLCYIFFHFFFFSVFCVLISFSISYPYVFFFQFVCFFSHLDENFWGVWVNMYYMQPHKCILKWVYT